MAIWQEPTWLQNYVAEQKAQAGSFGERYLKPFEQAAIAGISAYKSGEKSDKIKEILNSANKEIDDSIASVMKEIEDLERQKKSIEDKITMSEKATSQMEGYKPNSSTMEGYKPNSLKREPTELNAPSPIVLNDYIYSA